MFPQAGTIQRKTRADWPISQFALSMNSQNEPSTEVDSTYQVLSFSARNDKVQKTAQTPELESSPL
jgi:hypothetical protein